MPYCTGVIISDYSKGVITQDVVSCIMKEAKKRNIPVAYDPKRNHGLKMAGLALVTPNLKEAWDALGERPKPAKFDDDGRRQLMQLGCDLVKKWKAKHVMVTLGEHGIFIVGDNAKKGILYPSFAEEVRDVTGAGDTVVATAILALTSGANTKIVCLLSNMAAGLVVGKKGTSFCEKWELHSLLEDTGMWNTPI
jgi:D-beta-D-heptose 7-phosphate kinase/D-beta-D-heptose 1-phosphate adenosyltransferase